MYSEFITITTRASLEKLDLPTLDFSTQSINFESWSLLMNCCEFLKLKLILI